MEIVLCVFPTLWASVGKAHCALMRCRWCWPLTNGEQCEPILQVMAFWRTIKHTIIIIIIIIIIQLQSGSTTTVMSLQIR